MATIVAFSGAIRSGKSTLSQAVAEGLGWPRVSFGDYVRMVAVQRGLGQARETLQEVGASLIEGGWEEFCRSVLSQAEWRIGQSLIVDGVRHVEVLQTLQRITAPSKVVLVLVQLAEPERKARLEETGTPGARLEEWASHSTEVQVATTLPKVADLIVDGSRPLEELARKVEQWVRDFIAEVT